jgi:20S proteasome subunit beta 1
MNMFQLSAGIIVAGWDKYKGGQVYAVPIGGALVRQSASIGGSGSTYLYGFMDANYRENMNKEECVELVYKYLLHKFNFQSIINISNC